MVLRAVLTQQCPQMRLPEGALLASIPTIPSVSRQAAFAGKPPLYDPASIHRTDKEKALWEQFWQMQGLQPGEVAYAQGLGADADLATVADSIGHPKVRVVGLGCRYGRYDHAWHGTRGLGHAEPGASVG